jgi:hypothetical protein
MLILLLYHLIQGTIIGDCSSTRIVFEKRCITHARSSGAGIQPLGSDEPNTIHQTFIKLACDIAT